MNAFDRIIAPIKRRIQNMIVRGVVSAINNSENTQKIQLNLLYNETATDLERFENYGSASYPLKGAEALPVFLGGNRDHGIVLVIHDKRYRPDYLSEGEIASYTSEDKDSPYHRIHFKNGREIEIKCQLVDQDIGGDNTVDVGGDRTETIAGNKTETIQGSKSNTITGDKTENAANSTETITLAKLITSGATFTILSPSIVLNGAVVLGGGAGTGKALATEDILSVFNNHTHNENGDGGGVTDPPNSSLSASELTTNTKAN